MLRFLARLFISTFITWSIIGAAVILPTMAMDWSAMVGMSIDGWFAAFFFMLRSVSAPLSLLAGLLAIIITPLLHRPQGDPVLLHTRRACLTGLAASPAAAALWIVCLVAVNYTHLEGVPVSDWFILVLASASGGVIFAFIYSWLSRRSAQQDPTLPCD